MVFLYIWEIGSDCFRLECRYVVESFLVIDKSLKVNKWLRMISKVC